MLSRGYIALAAVGIVLFVAGIVFIALDYSGVGDTSGLDLKDVGLVVIGLILAAIGGAMAVRKRPASPPSHG
ncbi:MAG TPA: hypothetical protein VMV28_03705 [Thermoplasmata archaeon]|nr:hypothetical protein [Thermoplasmata archaeon]